MSTKRQPSQSYKSDAKDGMTTLKDLLSTQTIAKLKAQTDRMNQEALQLAAEKRKQEEEERKAEQKRKENDFGYLLEHSKLDMRKD